MNFTCMVGPCDTGWRFDVFIEFANHFCLCDVARYNCELWHSTVVAPMLEVDMKKNRSETDQQIVMRNGLDALGCG